MGRIKSAAFQLLVWNDGRALDGIAKSWPIGVRLLTHDRVAERGSALFCLPLAGAKVRSLLMRLGGETKTWQWKMDNARCSKLVSEVSLRNRSTRPTRSANESTPLLPPSSLFSGSSGSAALPRASCLSCVCWLTQANGHRATPPRSLASRVRRCAARTWRVTRPFDDKKPCANAMCRFSKLRRLWVVDRL